MNIDDFWLDDISMARISRQQPSTAAVVEFMRRLASRFPGLVSSETYRGYAMALSMVLSGVHLQSSIREIENVIEISDLSIQTSRTLPSGSDACGGAVLATTNAWEDSHTGISVRDFLAACEAQLILAGQKFVAARQSGI